MLPYTSHDLLRVLNSEITPKTDRELGSHLAQDIRPVDDDRDDSDGPDRGHRVLPRLFLRHPILTARGHA